MVRLSVHHVFMVSCGLIAFFVHAAPSDSAYYTSASSSAYNLPRDTPQTSFASDSTANDPPLGDNIPSPNPPVIHNAGDDGPGSREPGIGGPEDDDATQFHKQQSFRKSAQLKRRRSRTKSDINLQERLLAYLDQNVGPVQPAPYKEPDVDPNIDPRLLDGRGLGTLIAPPDSQVPAYTAGDATGIARGTLPPPAGVPPAFTQEELAHLERMLAEPTTPIKEEPALLEEYRIFVEQEAKEIPTDIQVEPPRRQRAPREPNFYVCEFVKPNGEQCSKTHDTRAALNHHQKNHGPKIHECHCGSSFAVRDQLAKHMRTVHAITSSYNCAPCNLHTSRRDVWNKHIKTEKHKRNVGDLPVIHQADISA